MDDGGLLNALDLLLRGCAPTRHDATHRRAVFTGSGPSSQLMALRLGPKPLS
ncbi:MAG: hypothetical protein U1F53_23260 [Burkholderiaceae bacterium]